MNPLSEHQSLLARRHFFGRAAGGIGTAALASLLSSDVPAAAVAVRDAGGRPGLPHIAPKARRVIYLCQSGAPSQMDLFDYKPKLRDWFNKELPGSVRDGQRLTTMTSAQKSFPVAPSIFRFTSRGASGAWLSELLPHTAAVADQICFIKSMHTEAINHDPAITLLVSGSQQSGRPSIGAWLSYGLGSANRNLPTFVALTSYSLKGGQPLYDRLWGSAFLPTRHQGVRFRAVGDPVLFLSNPPGINARARRQILHDVRRLNQLKLAQFGDPEIATRIAQYELAFRMQTSVPELADVSDEPAGTFELYGEDAKQPGSYAANCLLARRLAERGVRFIQLFHRGWDHHSNVQRHLPTLARQTDQGSAALVADLKQRGMLDETLVIWGGEFGRSVYSQGNPKSFGRDHHPRCFSIWMAGGGVKPGISYGQTDDYCYNITENPVHVHDFHATILHCLGIDHERLVYRFQGRDYRLTDVHGRVVAGILA